MNTTINETAYAERINKAFDEFINHGFINYSPWRKSDDEVITDAEGRSVKNPSNCGFMQDSQNFASIYTIGESKTLDYNGNQFNCFFLRPMEGKPIRLNFSDFKYGRSLDMFRGECFPSYNSRNANYANTVNDKIVEPYYDTMGQKGQQILVGYWFDTINAFDSRRPCYRLYTLTGNLRKDAEITRKQILRAQAYTLSTLARFPFKGVDYNNGCVGAEHYNIAEEQISQKMVQIRTKLYEIENELHKRGLSYEIVR